MTTPRIAFVTGANRGLGLETALLLAKMGHTVHAASRSAEGVDVIRAQAQSAGVADRVHPLEFDVTAQPIPDRVRVIVEACDILINNAGVGADVERDEESSVFTVDLDELKQALETNAWGAQRLISCVVPGMRARGYGRIVNVTSARASMGQWTGDRLAPVYRLSKLMLNGITAIAGVELQGSNVLINALCPGWCMTRMGGPQATQSVASGAARIVALATLPEGGSQGGYFVDDAPALF